MESTTDGLRAGGSPDMVGSDAAAKTRARRQRRVYLVPPARWKSARLSADAAAIDWSAVLPPPLVWSDRQRKPALLSKPDRSCQSTGAWSILATSLPHCGRTAIFMARQHAQSANAQVVRRAQAAKSQWAAWDRVNKRRALTALSFCAALGAFAVPLMSGVAHSQPELDTHAVLSGSVTAQTLAKSMAAPMAASPQVSTEKAREVESMPVLPEAAVPTRPEPPSSMALLSDVSTMDLMMPIAEPDLNIASHQSLWAQVGKEFGVDPLLLYSIALVESRSLHPGGDIGPTPWLFRVNDHLVVGERHHVQMEMAVASQLNATVQDVGIMQVYYPMHRSAVRDPLSLLDPKTNISVAAKILHDGMHETRDPVLGVGYYHSHTQQLARDYGTAVMTVYQRLKGIYHRGRSAQVVAR
jgi:soluble lytic murein transglycosylase-like protein